MINVRHGADRGVADLGWLDSRHTFSFGEYHDPEHMGFGTLRVINEDRVQPGQGFDAHSHQDMEIISYVLTGALAHEDSIGTGSVIRPGDVQRMSAGTGIRHSEFNHSDSAVVHFFQIWILPERTGLEPGYEQKAFAEAEKRGRLCLVGSRDARDGSLTIHQEMDLYSSLLGPGDEVVHPLAPGRKAWIQLARGSARVNGEALHAGDGAAIAEAEAVEIRAESDSELLLFDMA